ncbi:MAG: 50S ribosomal protein L13 [Patescibacteria group bacterium]|nr:50S ribosomal protein L13 [Patescibacteria group bacterium]
MKDNRNNSRKTYVIDGKNQILGRLATRVADLLRGKGNVNFASNKDMGDNVVVINALGINVTGKKMEDKIYYHHSGFPGGIKQKTLKEAIEKDPTWPLKNAVYGMLPKNKLRNIFIKKLRIFKDDSYKGKESDIKT